MVEVETAVERRRGITFVTAKVTNTRSTPQRVRLESTLDGPTWPPKRGEVRSPEWVEDTWDATVLPGQTRGTGFASPAEPTDSPVTLVSVSRASDDESAPSEEDVIADLDEWSPPTHVLLDGR